MCDQTEVSYLPGEVVWVKLGNVWWPAQVQDESKLDEDITGGLRKKPLAVVKFFDEDSYEFPKNLNQIYRYNCFKKDEFIKKGLDMCRPNNYKEISENMKKFPKDVSMAEKLTGGNPQIIFDPKYLPEEKFDYREEFGLKPRKKSSVVSKRLSTDSLLVTPRQSKVKFSTPISAPSTSRTPEFKALHKIKPMSNPIKKPRDMKRSVLSTVRKEVLQKKIQSNSLNKFNCTFCDYTAGRINVVIRHLKGHYLGINYPSPSHIPHNCYKVFQENFIKFIKGGSKSTPVALPKSKSDKIFNKRKLPEESSPIKKRKHESPKKEKIPTAVPSGSVTALAVPITDIVGPASTTKRQPRKSEKESKTAVVKEPEALDILKDWDDDLDEDLDIKLSNPENVKDSINETSHKNSNSLSENEEIPPKEKSAVPVTNTEKCCFDFDDNDESLNLNKSLKFGQKLPRVISEEKPNVQRLLQELKESALEEEKNEYNQEFETLLKTTEVPRIPDVPSCSFDKTEDNSMQNDCSKSEEKGVIENESLSFNTICSDLTENESLELPSEEHLILSKSKEEPSDISEISKNNLTKEPSEIKNDESTSAIEELNTNSDLKSTSSNDLLISEDVPMINSIETKQVEELEDLTEIEKCSAALKEKNKSEIDSLESENIIEEEPSLHDTAQNSLLKESDEMSIKIPDDVIQTEIVPIEEQLSSIQNDVLNSSEQLEKSHESVSSSSDNQKSSMHRASAIQNGALETNEESSNKKSQLMNDTAACDVTSGSQQKDEDLVLKMESNQFSTKSDLDLVVDNLVTSSETVHLPSKNEPDSKPNQNTSANVQNPPDQIPFDINSMPIVIDQDPIMEILDGHVDPGPNGNIVKVFIRNRGEEEPEDFLSPRRLLTVSPPPPGTPATPGVKKIPLPPPKNKNINTSNLPRYSLSKPPSKIVTKVQQQPQLLFIKSASGGSNQLLIPKQQSAAFATSGKLQPGTRILTTNAQLVSKIAPQKKVTSKQIIVSKQAVPTTSKIAQESALGQVFHKVSQQSIVANKSTSAVIVGGSKTFVSRSVTRNVVLTPSQLKNPKVSQTGTKVVRTTHVLKTQGSLFKPGETSQKTITSVSSSGMSEPKKPSLKTKPPGPNILLKTQRKPARQQMIKKTQVLTIPSSVQQQTAEVVAVNNLPIVQTITSHSSSEPVKMLYLAVDNNQYAVENTMIPVENDNRNIFVTSTPSSQNVDNLLFSIDGTGNLVNISNQSAAANTSHTPCQDILAKALADTQVLQSEATDIVESDNGVYVDQQYPAASLANTVLETSLTLNQPPIMTPLEVPSSVAPQSSISHIIPISNKSDIQQPSMPLLTDEVEVPSQFLADSSEIPTTSGKVTFQLVHDNKLVVTSGVMSKRNDLTDSKEDNVLPEFLKGNFGSKTDISKKDTTPKGSER